MKRLALASLNLLLAFTLLLPYWGAAQPASAARPAMAAAETNAPLLAQPARWQETDPTPTPGPAETETPPTPEPTPITPTVGLSLSAWPDAILPGSPLTLTWTVEHWELLALPAMLEIHLPEGLKPLSPSQDGGEQSGTDEKDSPAASARGDEKIIRIPLKEPSGSLVLASNADTRGPFEISAILHSGKEQVASANLSLAEDHVTQVGAKGGQVVGLNGRVQVDFPAGALPQTEGNRKGLRVHIRRSGGKTEPPYSLSPAGAFEITAENLAVTPDEQLTAVTHFNQPITITVTYSDSEISGDEGSLGMYYYDEEHQTWVLLPSVVYTQTNQVVAISDHLTNFDVSATNWEAARTPSLKEFQISPFAGGASYAYSFNLPPGPGGLQPSVGLSYSSQVVDNANSRTQAEWTGMGWSLEVGAITRNMRGSMSDLSDDAFSINANGISGLLLKGSDGYYHTANDSFARIQWNQNDLNSYQDDTWTVWDKQGNQYFFGLSGSERANYSAALYCQPYYDPQNPPNPLPPPDDIRTVTYKWMLSKVRNVFGQEIVYHYATESKSVWSLCNRNGVQNGNVTLAKYPEEILYPGGKYRLSFVRQANRLDYEYAWSAAQSSNQTFYEQSRLKEIRIEHAPDGNFANATLVRKYVLNYADELSQATIFPNFTWNMGGKTLTLVRIDEYGLNGAGPLPSPTFSYSADGMHLSQAANGYGGQASYTYEDWYETQTGPWAGFQQTLGGGGYNTPCSTYNPDDEGGWGGYGGSNNPYCTERGDGGPLMIPGKSTHVISPDYLYPGGRYEITLGTESPNGTQVQLGFLNGAQEVLVSGYTASNKLTVQVTLPSSASASAQFLIYCPSGCTMGSFTAKPMFHEARVVSQTLTDQVLNQSTVSTYRYDDPATNDAGHSELVSAVPEAQRFTPAYSEFRGHAMVQQTTPDGLTTMTFFHQDDTKSGSASSSLSYQRTWFDALESLTADWWAGGSAAVVERVGGDNAVKVSTTTTDWSVQYGRSGTGAWELQSGKSAIFQFRLGSIAANSQAAFMVDTGTFGQSSYHQWGFKAVNGGLYGYRCDTNNSACTAQATPFLSGIQANRWYVAILTLDDTNGFLAQAWERDAAVPVLGQYREIIPGGWPHGVAWKFVSRANNATFWLDEYSAGQVYSLSQTAYHPTSQAPVSVVTPPAPGLKIYWTRPEVQTALTFGGDSTFVGRRQYFHYETGNQDNKQFGNQTQVIESFWNGSAFQDYRSSWVGYHPNEGTPYLVSFPAYNHQYSCPAGSLNGACYDNLLAIMNNTGSNNYARAYLLSSARYIYDNNTADNQLPTQGVLARQRSLLRFADAGRTDLRYSDVTFAYDAWGNRTTTTAYDGEGTLSLYNQGSPRTSTTVYETTYHTYPTEERNPRYAQGFPATFMAYDYILGLPISITDPNGGVTSASYDAFGRMTGVTRPDSGGSPSVQITYHDTTQPFWTEVRQKTGAGVNDYVTVGKFYNGLGQIIQTQQADVQLTAGLRDVIVDTFYDTAGRPYRQSVPYDLSTGSGYRTPSAQPYTETAYDLFGRTGQVTAPDGTFTQTTYGDLSTTVRDARGNYTTTTLDARGRTVLVHPPTGPDVAYTYDDLDRLDTATRTAGVVTDIDYDVAGRKVRMVDPDMGTWYYGYDVFGNLTGQTDARGCVTTLSYDTLNRLNGKSYAGTDCTTPSVTYTYDSTTGGNKGWGRRTGMSDGSGSTAWVFDLRGRTTQETRTINGSGTFVTQWTYTLGDQPATMTYPDGELLTYAYHPQAVLSTLMSNKKADNQPGNYYLVQKTDYEAGGRVDYQWLAADALAPYPVFVNDYTYNGWTTDGGRLQRVNAGVYSNQTSLLDLRYDYDDTGNITSIQDYKIGSPQTQVFTYDSLNRLQSAYAVNGTTGNYASQATPQQYTYSSLTGNLASKTGVNYTYDTTHKHAVASTDAGWSYQYDANGNMTRRDPPGSDYYDFSYDAENRLYQVKKNNALLMTFTYDGDGARIKAAINGGATTVFVGGHYEVTGSLVTKYYAAGGQRLAMRQGSTLTYLLGDHLGSTSVSVNVATPGTVSRQGYYPWGETRFSSGTMPTKYQFTGQYSYATAATGDFGLMYYNARWYDPQLGRFAQADSVVPTGAQGLDRYAYVDNSPLNYIDPSGHLSCQDLHISEEDCKESGWDTYKSKEDPVRLTTWGARMQAMYYEWLKTPELWLSDSPPTLWDFLTIALAYDAFTGLALKDLNDPDTKEMIKHMMSHWFYEAGHAEINPGLPDEALLDSPNAIFNAVGLLQAMRRRWRAWNGGASLKSQFDQNGYRAFAREVVDTIKNSSGNPEWASVPGEDDPTTWGNAGHIEELNMIKSNLVDTFLQQPNGFGDLAVCTSYALKMGNWYIMTRCQANYWEK